MQDLIRLFCDSTDKFFARCEDLLNWVGPPNRSGHFFPDSVAENLHRDLLPKRVELLRVGRQLAAILERNDYDSSGLLAFLNALETWEVEIATSRWLDLKATLQRAAIRSPPRKPRRATPDGSEAKRGRRLETDLKADKQVYDAWKTGQYTKYADCGKALGKSEREVYLAIDRHRGRLRRKSRQRR